MMSVGSFHPMPSEVALSMYARFTMVGPGMAACQLLNTAYSWARVVLVGTQAEVNGVGECARRTQQMGVSGGLS